MSSLKEAWILISKTNIAWYKEKETKSPHVIRL